MSLFGNSVEVEKLKEEVRNREKEIYELRKQLEFSKRDYELKTLESVNAIKKEMQEKLVQSDMTRNEAVAKLEIYEKMDTKADSNIIKGLLSQLVTALGQKTDVKILK